MKSSGKHVNVKDLAPNKEVKMFELDLEPGFNKQELGVADKAVFYKKGIHLTDIQKLYLKVLGKDMKKRLQILRAIVIST